MRRLLKCRMLNAECRILVSLFFFSIFLTSYFILNTSSVHAQTIDYRPYCTELEAYPVPENAQGQPTYEEPSWEELDEIRFKTTVTDTFQMIDRLGLAGRGGSLSSQSLLLPNAKEVADYLEGAYLDEDHRLKDLRTLKSQDFQSYFGTVVKLTPQKNQDRLKVGYVGALYFDGRRRDDGTYKTPDILLTYTDVCNNAGTERTIYDLVTVWGMPQPPSLANNPTEEDFRQWRRTWGRYWPKIPLHDPGGVVGCDPTPSNPENAVCRASFPEGVFGVPPNMLSQGCLVLRRFEARNTPVGPLPDCPQPNPPNILVIKLGVPDVFRLDTLARFTQQLLIPQKLMNLYFCKFRANPNPGNFCGEGEQVTSDDCVEPVGEIEIEVDRLGSCAPAQGEQGVGGTPVKIYDPQISILGGSETVENIDIETKLPYLGLTFGKLTSALVGTFKFFDPLHAIPTDPLASWLNQEKYQQNSTKLPYTWSFTDTTIPVPGGYITEPPVWAGFLSGIKKSKNFVICTLLPSPHEAATCANENLQYNPVSR